MNKLFPNRQPITAIETALNRLQIAQVISRIALGMWAQFGAILGEPVIGKVDSALGSGWKFVRVHFRASPLRTGNTSVAAPA